MVSVFIKKEKKMPYFFLHLAVISLPGNVPVKKKQNLTELKRSHTHLSSPPLTYSIICILVNSHHSIPYYFFFYFSYIISLLFHLNLSQARPVLLCIDQHLILVKADASWCCTTNECFVVYQRPWIICIDFEELEHQWWGGGGGGGADEEETCFNMTVNEVNIAPVSGFGIGNLAPIISTQIHQKSPYVQLCGALMKKSRGRMKDGWRWTHNHRERLSDAPINLLDFPTASPLTCHPKLLQIKQMSDPSTRCKICSTFIARLFGFFETQ